MTIATPQVFNNFGQTSTVSGTDQTQNITTMSDGTFVTAYNIGGSLRAQHFDQFGNRKFDAVQSGPQLKAQPIAIQNCSENGNKNRDLG